MDNLGNKKRENSANEAQEDQEEIVLRVTAHYVEEVQAGRQPDISDYLSRYPQYADAIASFIAYYHTVELPLSQSQIDTPDHIGKLEETCITDEFASVFHIATETAWQQLMPPGEAGETENNIRAASDDRREKASYVSEVHTDGAIDTGDYGQTIHTLFIAAKQQHLSTSQLAAHLHISEDIVALLEQQAIMPASIPLELYRRLATVLQQPVHHLQHPSMAERQQRVAEHPGWYKIGTTTDGPEQISFREALETSEMLSAEQAQYWHDVFSQEEW